MSSLQKLESLQRLGWRFGLETIQALMVELGNPHRSLKFIHVAGSNGKGSTCAYLASFLKHSGTKTGLYTSPHLSDIRERFRINGRWISPESLERLAKDVLGACQRVFKRQGHLPTHFEALTALAALWFKREKVDWVVWEVGLGGRLDATNVIGAPAVALITPVGLEHQDILGSRLSQIAAEKAGILKAGSLSATIQYQPEALGAIEKKALAVGVPLWVGGRDFIFGKGKKGFYWEGPGFKGSLLVPHIREFQMINASLALAGIQCLQAHGVTTKPALVQKAFSAMRWPGRIEVLRQKPLVVLDGAHNPDASKALATSLPKAFPRKRWIILNGFLKDKDYKTVIRFLKPMAGISIATEPPSERAEKAFEVFRAWEREDVPVVALKDWRTALQLAERKLKSNPGPYALLITGSIYLGGACRSRMLHLKGLEVI